MTVRELTRRGFLRASAMAGAIGCLPWDALALPERGESAGEKPGALDPTRLFPSDLAGGDWSTFRANGYANKVSGICYRTKSAGYFSEYVDKPYPCSGMPLGAIDTGALYLEPSGAFGYTSIFNHQTPIGGPLNTPYLGVAIGGTCWVCGTAQSKNYAGNNRPSLGIKVPGSMRESHYWGHYPIADIEYESACPVEVGVRAWSSFIPGDSRESNIPGAVFEVHLRNTSTSEQAGSLLFSFPGFADHRSADTSIGWPDMPLKPVMPPQNVLRRKLADALSGVWVEEKNWGMSYVVAALDEKSVRTGAALGIDNDLWTRGEKALPEPASVDDGGASLAIDFRIPPGGTKTTRIVLAWYAREWEGNGNPGTGGRPITTYAPEGLAVSTTGKRFTHMYAARFKDAGEVAEYLARHHAELLRRIIAWQSAVYDDPSLPGWLADSLINSLYYFAPCSMWAQAKEPIGKWCQPQDGLFALEESPRACPHMSTLSNVGMQGPTLSFFFPDLALSLLRGFRATQKENGDVAQLMGRWADPANPMSYDYQEVLSGFCYVSTAFLHWRITGDEAFMREFYPSVKRALEYSFTQRPDLGDAQIIAMPPHREHAWNDIDWWEDRSMYGFSSHSGGLRIAGAEMLKMWAEAAGDTAEAVRMDKLIAAGKDALQKHLWRNDHYLIFNDPVSGKSLDAFFSPQLNGQYWARFCGLPSVFPAENVTRVLAVLRDKVCKLSKTGMPPLYCMPDGSLWTSDKTGYLTGEYVFTNHQVMWNAMTFLYEGQKDFGMELLHKNLSLNYLTWGYQWDGPNCCSAGGDTGEVNYGWDYWFNWSIWNAPAALRGSDITALTRPGGLVHTMLQAGKRQ